MVDGDGDRLPLTWPRPMLAASRVPIRVLCDSGCYGICLTRLKTGVVAIWLDWRSCVSFACTFRHAMVSTTEEIVGGCYCMTLLVRVPPLRRKAEMGAVAFTSLSLI